MSKSAHLVYPHQLFKKELLPEGITHLFMIEDPLYFGTDEKYPVYFHKQKLILHRAAMRRYIEEVLWPAGLEVEYVAFSDLVDSGDIIQKLKGFDSATVFDVTDDVLQRRLQTAAITVPDAPILQFLDTPNFYLKRAEAAHYFAASKKPSFDAFYQWQRERWNILIGDDYKPVGGKWSFDTESRKRLPEGQVVPTFEVFGSNKYVDEAREYVAKNFPNNPGNDQDFCWATNHAEAEQWLAEFVKDRLSDFGPYQDAIDAQAPWAYHGGLSPALNCGLLQPQHVVDAVLAAHAKKPMPLPSIESFIRHILGWREYVRGIYQMQHAGLRTANVFAHKNRLSQDWYEGTTGLPPVDDAIKKAHARGYLQSVERQMVIGTAMFLTQVDPKEVYQWYMEMMIDAYDWTLVPNVYGFSQCADGGALLSVPPAICDSDLLMRMSYYQKDDWADVWDGLYWGFIDKHRTGFNKKSHLAAKVLELDRMDDDRRRILGYRAQDFLNAKTKQAEN